MTVTSGLIYTPIGAAGRSQGSQTLPPYREELDMPLEEPEQSSQALRGRRKGSEGLLARKTLRENT
jgi:hypothetical protein